MKSIAQQTGLLSNYPLRGYYRYNDLFQILPAATKNQSFQQDHPLILEISYFSDVWPHRNQLLWHRDLWERKRFEYIRNHSIKKKMDSSDDWIKAYQQQTALKRLPALRAEVSGLLTLFANHRFFTYTHEQHWFIPTRATDTDVPARSIWGQIEYIFGPLESGSGLSKPTCAAVTKVPVQKYYASIRDVMYAGEDNTVQLPENIDQLFDHYFKLHPDRKTGFHTACHLYNRALELHTTSASLSLVAAVMAIEALVNCSRDDSPAIKVCEECHTPESIEKCPVCGLPRYRATSRFKQFLTDFGSEKLKKFANELYKTRSKLAHGGLLRDDLHDSGFYAGSKDEEAMFLRNSLSLIRIAMLNWLIKS
ncbi:MAG: hypothetical protein IIA60_02100 [Candidatus Marinimicrobia bacterium]|nr:hypothetical protein [Candidatus Neomarinimicrobiota bacterium]